MIHIRLFRGVLEHFPARITEWVWAAWLFGWGISLGKEGNMFDVAPVYSGLAAIAPERTWAWACLIIGAVRLIALFVNGTFSHMAYGRFSPHVRSLLSFVSVFVWSSILIGVLSSGVPTTGHVIYSGILFVEIWNCWSAVKDAAEADRSHVDARTGPLSG